MLVQILDAQAQPHFVTWQGADQINDYSGNLATPNAFQQLLPANTTAPGAAGCRCNWLFQNTSQAPMLINVFAGSGIAEPAQSFIVPPGGCFPPCNFPLVTGEIQIAGSNQSQAGDSFTCHEFVNAGGE